MWTLCVHSAQVIELQIVCKCQKCYLHACVSHLGAYMYCEPKGSIQLQRDAIPGGLTTFLDLMLNKTSCVGVPVGRRFHLTKDILNKENKDYFVCGKR